MWLLGVAILGFAVGNGLFIDWLVHDYHGLSAVWSDHLAMAFAVDALLTLLVLTVHFARQPQGRVRWPWFLVLSIVGGICFALPLYLWLNTRSARSVA
jgi:hypothetical protein